MWGWVPLVLLVRFAVATRGWTLAAAVCLVLATPLVAAFSYAVGPYDARPWWEGISGLLTATAGLCLLVAAAFSGRSPAHERAGTVASDIAGQQPSYSGGLSRIQPVDLPGGSADDGYGRSRAMWASSRGSPVA